jgi:hypothetical protein
MTEIHLTPQLSGHRRGCQPARDRIVSQAMIGAAAFILLKAGVLGPESAKQPEIRLAGLPTILCIGRRESKNPLAERGVHMQRLCERNFRRIWLIGRESRRYVIWITVLAENSAQYPARVCRNKLM